ncbi:MAG TPA: hypothetical protein VGF69_07940 [Thermoanaerobaculia bacterium]|jgi:hypothetical protein
MPRGARPVSPAVVALLLSLLFLAVRAAMLFAREPFFDELFTVWMARRPFAAILPALLHDSGPPLYYWMARIPSVFGLRLLSLAFACVPFALLLRRRRFVEAALLAVYPPAVLFAVDARAYALCGALVAVAVLLLEKRRPYAAAVALAAAGYAHYYAVLLFPLLLWRGGDSAEPSHGSHWSHLSYWSHRFPAALAALLFIPGFLLALRQPREALAWNRQQPLYTPLLNLSFAGDYPAALLLGVPAAMAITATALLLIAGARSARYLPFVVVPLLVATLFALTGRTVYYPLRFESVIAFPLVLWLGASVARWGKGARRALTAALLLTGVFALYRGIDDHLRRPLDPYREAALTLKARAGAEPVVASGYLYLEAVTQLGERVIPFPPEQAQHPGWRAIALVDAASLPRQPFLWIGERQAPELGVIRRSRRIEPLFANDNALIVRVH